MTERENFLRALEFRYPEWIPCSVGFAPLLWKARRRELEALMGCHPLIFRDEQREALAEVEWDEEMPPVYRQGEHFTDNWGCVWHNIQEGLEGQVVGHPLADWAALDSYQPPDPRFKAEREDRDWDEIKRDIAEWKRLGRLTRGSGERLFDRMYFLRGWEDLMADFAADDPHLPRLIEMLTDYEMRLIRLWLEIGVDVMGFHTDIGTQRALMISPEQFRRTIKPMFKKLFMTCREAGSHVMLSSDGCLLEIVDDLVECGVSAHDPQLRANTLEGIARAYKGKLCINLDLDRQMFAFCKPEDIRQQVKEAVGKLAMPEGGLMMFASFYGGKELPLANVEAACLAFEEFCFKN